MEIDGSIQEQSVAEVSCAKEKENMQIVLFKQALFC